MITVNGEKQKYAQLTVQELLVKLELTNILCAIEVNDTLVPHNERNEYILQDEDKIEIVSLVGGG